MNKKDDKKAKLIQEKCNNVSKKEKVWNLSHGKNLKNVKFYGKMSLSCTLKITVVQLWMYILDI